MKIGQQYDVAIVGLGPAGAIAACWLGQAGIKTVVLERSRTIWDIPRAIALDHEILRVFQNLGVIDQVLPYTAPFGASEHFGARGQLIRRIDVVPAPYPLGYPPNIVFSQPPVEKILRERAQAHDSVAIQLGREVTGLTQCEHSVELSTRDDSGATDVMEAKYVIACDGASSTVRRLLNIALEDLGFDEPWLVVDLMVNDEAIARLPSVCAQYCEPARPCTYIIGPGNHRRWEIMLNDGEDPRQMESNQRVGQLLSRWLQPSDARIWRAGSYRFHALVAQHWRSGHVFLAGDAAHQQPPFIGQGMCQGVRDVTNLCWKLIAVLRSEAGSALLDTYEQERKQHVRVLTERIKEIGTAICARDPEEARRRDEALLKQGGGQVPVVTRQEIVPPLQCGLLRLELSKTAGSIFPQPWVFTVDGVKRLDDLSGPGWSLVVDGRYSAGSTALHAPGIATLVIGGSGLQEKDGVLARWFDTHGCSLALVRPDHYVYCGLTASDQVERIWRDIRIAVAADRLATAAGNNAPTGPIQDATSPPHSSLQL
ncbi:MAG TPA: bifunctional 3-(3-hydroxy-phenyl)propionate/3-hydroxycinnamic acid hydroxylase [Terracidiphilus sp.]|nr:bifunctional 3-(3-hydroxy-phenyl)propionate/3-hydroxycinnamic acid hydroxylase [Terracidiphilus sp.]